MNVSPPAARSWSVILAQLIARQDLTADAATWAAEHVIGGVATPVQLAAFLTALKAKGETAVEINGFVTTLLKAATPVHVAGPTVDIAGTGGDGTNTVNISTMAAIVVAATGTTVVKHGGRAATATTAGSADLVEGLGIPLDLPAERHAAVAMDAGITFLLAAQVHLGLRQAGSVRRELGIPTIFNALGPLINPANPTHRLIGVADVRLLPIIVDVLRARRVNALVVRGDDGLDKISTATTSQIWRVHDGRATHHIFDPRTLNIPGPAPDALRGGDAAANAQVLHALLAGRRSPVRDAVVLNAAAALVTAESPVSHRWLDQLRAATRRCAAAIDSGAAEKTLSQWISVAQAHRRPEDASAGLTSAG